MRGRDANVGPEDELGAAREAEAVDRGNHRQYGGKPRSDDAAITTGSSSTRRSQSSAGGRPPVSGSIEPIAASAEPCRRRRSGSRHEGCRRSVIDHRIGKPADEPGDGALRAAGRFSVVRDAVLFSA